MRTSAARPDAATAVLAAVVVALSACLDPVLPGSGIPTLDDRGADGFVAVSVGLEHTCALAGDGSAYCWGSNEYGQLGTPDGATRCAREDRMIPCERRPRAVSGTLRFRRIAAGSRHTCALAQDGRVYCWGDNQRGQLGDPVIRQTDAPAPVQSSAIFTSVSAGDAHSCAVRSDNVVMCWGANDAGQLGINTVGAGSGAPVAVQTPLRFASVSTGVKRTCARLPDGTPYCWGSTWIIAAVYGSDITRPQAQPSRVLSSPPFQQLAVGGATTCGLAQDGSAHCWESNRLGTMGDGSTVGSAAPKAVTPPHRFTAISAGGSHTCGLADTGSIHCWGSDASGQLGVAPSGISRRCGQSSVPCHVSPVRASGWRVYSAVSAGLGDHTCGLTLAGNVYCWGAGSMGQRGDGSASATWSPTRSLFP